ncbi:unnamed protein product, partial [marine sediment metagenome]
MNIKEFFAQEGEIIDSALDKFLPENAEPEIITKAMRYSIFAG